MDLMMRTCNYDAMGGERLAARLFVVLGGIFWIIAALAGTVVYTNLGFAAAAGQALLPFALAAVALLVGWFFERVAAVLLFIGAIAAVAWGVIIGWEAGVWGLMALALIAPTVIAGLLFLMAARTQKNCEAASAS